MGYSHVVCDNDQHTGITIWNVISSKWWAVQIQQ